MGVDVNGTGREGRRPTLALLVSELEQDDQTPIWNAISGVVRAADANLLCYAGGRLGGGDDKPFEIQRNGVYELVAPDRVDGLIVVSTSIGRTASTRELAAFIRAFRPIPAVSLGVRLRAVPSVTVDTSIGLRAALTHLIEDHDLRRIAFVRASAGRSNTDERYDVYRRVLEDHSIPFDADLVVPSDAKSGEQVCRVLLDERAVMLDALLAVDDSMAFSVITELQSRGVRVPYDVAVVGCEDVLAGGAPALPLTTVRQPTRDMAVKATEMALALVRGETVRSAKLPSALVVGQSCGCVGPSAAGVSVPPGPGAGRVPDAASDQVGGLALIDDLVEGLERVGIEPAPARQLSSALVGELEGVDGTGHFMAELSQLLASIGTGVDFQVWQAALTELRMRGGLHVAGDAAKVMAFGELVDQARMSVSGAAQLAGTFRAMAASRLEETLRQVGLDLLAAFDADHLIHALEGALPCIGAESCVLALYQSEVTEVGSASTHTPVPEWANLVLAYTGGQRVELGGEQAIGTRVRSRSLVPSDLLPADRAFSFVVQPLTFEIRQLGYLLIEPGPPDGRVYGALQGYLSTAVQGTRMAETMARRAQHLQAALGAVEDPEAGSDPDRLAQHIVDELQASLEAGFVGLYQVEGQWASLWAGTGEAGVHMRSEGHRLRVGGTTAVGQCAVETTPIFARARDGGTTRVGDEYVPGTRSEVALPLLSGGEVLGILSIRSDDEDAYSAGDLPTLVALGGQIGGAVARARLLERTQRALTELQTTQGRAQQLAWSDYLELAPVTEFALGESADDDGSSIIEQVNAILSAGETSGDTHRDSSALVVPITQSGATIGALGVAADGQRQWTADEMALAESVVERMGLAMENLRLLDETRRSVAVGQLTQSITAEMRQSLDVDQVLRAAVQRIAEAFDAAEVTVRLSAEGAVDLAPDDGGGPAGVHQGEL